MREENRIIERRKEESKTEDKSREEKGRTVYLVAFLVLQDINWV